MRRPHRKIRPAADAAVIVVCWRCEFEWDGDKLSASAACPACGAECDGEDHTVDTTRAQANA